MDKLNEAIATPTEEGTKVFRGFGGIDRQFAVTVTLCPAFRPLHKVTAYAAMLKLGFDGKLMSTSNVWLAVPPATNDWFAAYY